MTRTNKNRIATHLLAALLAGAAVPLPAAAQDGGALITLGVSTGLFYEESEDDPTESGLRTRLDFGLFTETRNQRFAFSLGTVAEATEADTGFTDPRAALSYALFSRNTELGVELAWRETEVGDGELEEDFDSDDLIDDDGTRELHEADITLITGRAARFGTTTTLGYSEVNYRDVNDPDLVDRVRLDAGTTLRFTVNRQVELRLFGTWVETDEEDAENTLETVTRFGIGGDVVIDHAWRASGQVALRETETETDDGLGGRTLTTEDGYEIALDLIRDLRNGTLRFSLSLDEEEGDEINSLEVARAMTLANGADLDASIGVVAFEDGDVLPILGLGYRQEVLRGSVVSVRLTQSGGENDDDENILRTRFDASLRQELGRNDSLSLTGSLASVDVLEGGNADTMRGSLGLAYSRDLDRNWALVAAANRRVTYEDGDRTDQSNIFSLSLERSFSFRP